jgi:two-component system, cell cycle sensor histidine kinase and response regulator CckA
VTTPSQESSGTGSSTTTLASQHSRRLESLITMALGVAHDLNNTMACVLGNNGILGRNLPPESPIEENVKQIEEAALTTVELAKNLMFFSGRVKVNAVTINLSTLIADLQKDVRTLVREDVALALQLDPEVPPLRADAGQIRLAVTHLVRNAVDFPGKRRGEITLRTGWMHCDRALLSGCYFDDPLTEGPYAYFEVTDNGRGIQSHVMERIFDPFFTTKMRGNGLGLSVVVGIVRAHHGAVSVSSESGQGSTFRIYLPCIA